MSTQSNSKNYEYPDAAGYPDGGGFLDEGTAAAAALPAADDGDALRDADRPSADSDFGVRVNRDDSRLVYSATVGDREVAAIRYDEVDGRIVVLSTTVVPEFRGRGIAEELIAYALDDVRARGMRVTVYCAVVTAFLRGNRQFTDLIDPDYPGR